MSQQVESREQVSARRNGVGVGALVLGVLSLVLALLVLFFPIAAILGLIAVILGFLGIGRASRGEADNRGQAIAGLITGALALALAVFFTISIGAFFAQHQNDFRQFGNCMLGADDKQQRNECGRTFTDKLDQP
ncbi:MAG: DUF4190 domain-containing protein [Actinomycetota bacterium]|nr:DUF4190 domain-containing protein [Actinomycetota bacterium]